MCPYVLSLISFLGNCMYWLIDAQCFAVLRICHAFLESLCSCNIPSNNLHTPLSLDHYHLYNSTSFFRSHFLDFSLTKMFSYSSFIPYTSVRWPFCMVLWTFLFPIIADISGTVTAFVFVSSKIVESGVCL